MRGYVVGGLGGEEGEEGVVGVGPLVYMSCAQMMMEVSSHVVFDKGSMRYSPDH